MSGSGSITGISLGVDDPCGMAEMSWLGGCPEWLNILARSNVRGISKRPKTSAFMWYLAKFDETKVISGEGNAKVIFVRQDITGRLFECEVVIHVRLGMAKIFRLARLELDWSVGFMPHVPFCIGVALDWLWEGARLRSRKIVDSVWSANRSIMHSRFDALIEEATGEQTEGVVTEEVGTVEVSSVGSPVVEASGDRKPNVHVANLACIAGIDSSDSESDVSVGSTF